MTIGNPIGPLGQSPQEYSKAWADGILDRLDRIHIILARAINTGWTTSNVTTTRALNANSTTLAEVADVLCTLIEDMKSRGTLSK
jgi:hypothetical protein